MCACVCVHMSMFHYCKYVPHWSGLCSQIYSKSGNNPTHDKMSQVDINILGPPVVVIVIIILVLCVGIIRGQTAAGVRRTNIKTKH